MKIVIDKLQHQKLLSDIDQSAGRKIIGGATIEGNTTSFALVGSNLAGASSKAVSTTDNGAIVSSSTTAIALNKNDNGFSGSTSSSFSYII